MSSQVSERVIGKLVAKLLSESRRLPTELDPEAFPFAVLRDRPIGLEDSGLLEPEGDLGREQFRQPRLTRFCHRTVDSKIGDSIGDENRDRDLDFKAQLK